MDNTTAPPLRGDKTILTQRIASAPGYLLGFDFDGTLAPIMTDREAPRIDPALAQSIQTIANRDNTHVAIISGRELEDLASRITVENVQLAGNHGLEQFRAGEYFVVDEAAQYTATLQECYEILESALSEIHGCEIEYKGLTVTIHVRKVTGNEVNVVKQMVMDVADTEGLSVSSGKQVYELKPAVEFDKGTAMQSFLSEVPDSWLGLYLGDDTTDEDVFEAIQPRGIGIHIGPGKDTCAKFRLPSQEAVADFVTWFDTIARMD